MSDPLADHLESEDNPYGYPSTYRILHQLFSSVAPYILAQTTGTILKRLALLEMYLEEERGISVSEDELREFLHRRHPEIEKEMEKLAMFFYGSIARLEGG